jgi:hypothetical protein
VLKLSPLNMSSYPDDFYHLPSGADTVSRILIGRKCYVFNTPYRWGRPVEHEWVDIGEPWSTHWTSVVLDRDRGNPLVLNTHEFFIQEVPELLSSDAVAFPLEDLPGYWKCPSMGLSYYFAAKVRVCGSDLYRQCWFELTDEEEERLWERHQYNDMVYNPGRYDDIINNPGRYGL